MIIGDSSTFLLTRLTMSLFEIQVLPKILVETNIQKKWHRHNGTCNISDKCLNSASVALFVTIFTALYL